MGSGRGRNDGVTEMEGLEGMEGGGYRRMVGMEGGWIWKKGGDGKGVTELL